MKGEDKSQVKPLSEDVYNIRETSKYVVASCKLCGRFNLWFNKPTPEEPSISFNRVINLGHLPDKHNIIAPKEYE